MDDKNALLKAQHAIETLLKEIILLIPRSTGNNWEIVKIHEKLHVLENIELFGAHRNAHTGPQEHNHIQNTKKPSKQVQSNKFTFDWELGNRLSDKYIIDSACQKFAASHETNASSTFTPDYDGSMITPDSSKFTFKLKKYPDSGKVQVSYKWITLSGKANPLTKPILLALIDHFGDEIYDQSIIGFSELKHNNALYRASAEYRNRGCWYDNALIAWVNKQECPNQETDTFLFIPLELRLFFKCEQEAELYCIVHSCEYSYNQHSVLSVKWKKEYLSQSNVLTREPLYHVISCDSIDSHCLLLPYEYGLEYVLQILHPRAWANKFLTN